jgi:hypothetical protein
VFWCAALQSLVALVEQGAIVGGLITVKRGEVTVAVRALPIARGCFEVGICVVGDTCFTVSEGDEIARLRLVVAGAGGSVSLHGRKVTLVGRRDCLGDDPLVVARHRVAKIDRRVRRSQR